MTDDAASPGAGGEGAEYPEGVFWLPTSAIGYYDEPDVPWGDAGWHVDEVEASIAEHGQREPMWVGMSAHDLAERGDDGVVAFNGNHRLQVLRRLGVPFAKCEDADGADDNQPLTTARILALGGRIGPGAVGRAENAPTKARAKE